MIQDIVDLSIKIYSCGCVFLKKCFVDSVVQIVHLTTNYMSNY